MWNRARVRSTSLQALGQIAKLSRRYKIDKIQKLSANFEKACWRSVRCAEERAYHQKYAFLRHCINVIDSRRRDKKGTVLMVPGTASQLAEQFNGENAQLLLKKVSFHIEAITKELHAVCEGVPPATVGNKSQSDVMSALKEQGLSSQNVQLFICKLRELSKLKRLSERLESLIGKGYLPGETKGFTRQQLLHMALERQEIETNQP